MPHQHIYLLTNSVMYDIVILPMSKSRTTPQHKALTLKHLGFTSWASYLSSEMFHLLRIKRLKRYPRCFICNDWATEVVFKRHRISDLRGGYGASLLTLCSSCYLPEEMDTTKVTVHELNKRLISMRYAWEREHGRTEPTTPRPIVGEYTPSPKPLADPPVQDDPEWERKQALFLEMERKLSPHPHHPHSPLDNL